MVAMLEMIVAVAAAYWGWFYFSRGRRSYGALIVGAGLAAAIGSLGPKLDLSAGTSGLIGGLGAGAVVMLLLVGPLCRAAARAVVQSDRLRLASALLEIAEVLMPGAGVGDDKLALAALREVRAGRIDDTVAALEHGKSRLPASLGRAIDERITMLYLSAHRWKEAVDHVDRNLPRPSAPPDKGPEPQDAWSAARAALGMSPPLWVEVLGAVAREGDLDRAATMLRELEAACGGRDDSYWIVHRGRLVFLAFAGRTAAVDRLVAPELARHMTRSARSYWRGIAAAQAGDAAKAEGAYQHALARSRGRARELVTRAIDELPQLKPAEASPLVQATADEAEAAPLSRPEPVMRKRRTATVGLIAINLGVAAAIALAFGSASDPAVVIRAGGALRGAIDHGEWWRLITTAMVHIGIIHLVLNMLALLALGRWAETVFGGRAVVAIYALGGIAGAVASYLIGIAPLSAGASGAIFALLGAFVIELVWFRRAYRSVWQSGMMGALLVAIAAQMALGYSLPQDQWAHLGGFVAGMLGGIALSPHRKHKRAVKLGATAIAVAAATLATFAIMMVARTDYGDTLARFPRATKVADGIAITVPERWRLIASDYIEPDLYISVYVARGSATDWIATEAARARENRGFDTASPAPDRKLVLPPGWQGSELVATVSDDLIEQRYRVLAATRPDGIIASVYIPEALADDAADQLAAMLASIEDRRAPSP
jgi:membrane associated rhomboid family serine protease